MPAKVFHVLNTAQIDFILKSPHGAVAKDLIKRGIRVQSKARRNLGGATGSGPKRIDNGLLRASISTQLGTDADGLVMRVGSRLYYSRWVHDGTGIFGPRRMRIYPKKAKFLHWKTKAGKSVFRKSVAGMRPNTYLKSALPAYRASSSG